MYRQEYPRPTFVRNDWQNLNGAWEFEINNDNCNLLNSKLSKEIQVPFCPESKLSGICNKSFMKYVWYRRDFTISTKQLNGKVIIHFGAIDYESTIYVNKQKVGKHKGGFTGFEFEITDYLNVGKNTLDIQVIDDTTDNSIPTGKQSTKKDSYCCYYTRSTGIWQTVWLEFVSKNYIKTCNIKTDIQQKNIYFTGEVVDNCRLNISVLYKNKLIANKVFNVENNYNCEIKLNEIQLWDTDNPNLYDINLKLLNKDNNIIDEVDTYTAFRKIEIKQNHFYLNNKKIILKQVLDQGLYPDGIYTAPNVEDIYKDVDLALEFGFNGARLHQKVFEEHYLYYADTKGFLVWCEYPNWGCDFTSKSAGVKNLTDEWIDVVKKYMNHPCIIGWCPLNEVWINTKQKCSKKQQIELVNLTRSIDDSRIVIGASGGDTYCGDLWDFHTYVNKPEKLDKIIKKGKVSAYEGFVEYLAKIFRHKLYYKSLYKLPKYLSEYGGTTFASDDKNWGYNKEIKSEKEFLDKFTALTKTIQNNDIFGYCYTQLYDVEQEQNGLTKYDRTHKFNKQIRDKIKECNLNDNN